MNRIRSNDPLWGFRNGKLSGYFSEMKKKVTGSEAASRYSENPEKGSTVIPALSKALWIYSGRNSGGRKWALGKMRNGKYAAELQSLSHPEITSIVIYDEAKGSIRAAAYDSGSGEKKRYSIDPDYAKGSSMHYNCDGTAIFLALMPEILSDEEAANIAASLKEDSLTKEEMNVKLAAFSDNVYRRAVYLDGLPGTINLEQTGEKGALKGFNMSELKTPDAKIKETIAGSFDFVGLSDSEGKTVEIPEGKYSLGAELSQEQKKMIRPLPKGHVSSAVEGKILEIIKRTRDSGKAKVSNILLEGPPGTGKSQMAVAISHHLGLPYYTLICSDGTNEDSLLGCYYPYVPDEKNGEISDFRKKRADFPSNLEIEFRPEEAFEKLTGKKQEGITTEEVYSVANLMQDDLLKQAESLIKSGSGSGISYRYCPSPLVEAFREGGVIEIQEPSAIVSASVLSCLNDIMNSSDGIINTPIGPVKRHENCYVIATTNPETNGGYRKLNEAVRNRFQRTYRIDLPTRDEMVSRVLSQGALSDAALAEKMANVISVIEETLTAKAIQGTAGMRCLFEWAKDVAAGDSITESMMSCVINNVTTDRDEQEIIIDALRNNTDIYSIEEGGAR